MFQLVFIFQLLHSSSSSSNSQFHFFNNSMPLSDFLRLAFNLSLILPWLVTAKGGAKILQFFISFHFCLISLQPIKIDIDTFMFQPENSPIFGWEGGPLQWNSQWNRFLLLFFECVCMRSIIDGAFCERKGWLLVRSDWFLTCLGLIDGSARLCGKAPALPSFANLSHFGFIHWHESSHSPFLISF